MCMCDEMDWIKVLWICKRKCTRTNTKHVLHQTHILIQAGMLYIYIYIHLDVHLLDKLVV